MARTRQTSPNRSTSRTSASATPASVLGPRLIVIVSTLALTCIGLVMVFSASSVNSIVETGDAFSDAGKQIIFMIIGAGMCVFVARALPYRWLRGPITWGAFIISVLLLLLTAGMGIEGLGAQRWLVIGGFNMQPSEFAKIGILLFAAVTACDYSEGRISLGRAAAYFALLHVIIIGLILVLQSDMGTTFICIVGILAIAWFSEFPLRFFALYGAAVAAVGALALTVGYRSDRLSAFLDPWSDYYGTGYQLIHSFYAFSQGGIFGTGLGNSAEKYQYLPEAHTDFIFSIIGEELGFVGAAVVILLFVALLYGGLRMAQEAPDTFGTVVCGSFSVIIAFQAFLNIGMSLGVLPITGKPLPFISAGGSSLIASLVMVGIMLMVSHASDESPVYRQRREDLQVIRTRPQASTRSRSSSAMGRAQAGASRTRGASRSRTQRTQSQSRTRQARR